MMASPAPQTALDILRAGVAVLADRLPPGWTVLPQFRSITRDARPDGSLLLAGPDGDSATLVLEVKSPLESRDVLAVREQLARFARQCPPSHAVVVSRYLSRPVRKRLADEGLSYADATGNVLLKVPKPALFVSTQGADRDPWRGPGRPRGTLRGAPAAKVVRALVDFGGPTWTIRQLIKVAGVSVGSGYRVIEFLQGEELARRDDSGAVMVPDWVVLLRRWSDDYGFARYNRVSRWIAPRGLPDLMKRVANSSVTYAVTGTLAAAEWAAYAPARSAMIYSADAEQAAKAWDLRPVDAGANVMLAEPASDVVFARTLKTEAEVTIAAPAQVVVDLMTGPGRSPSEAEELIEWMTRNESSWRR